MKVKKTIISYPSRNVKTEIYKEDDTLVTRYFYDAKNAYVKELTRENGANKEVTHYTLKGVLAKVENFVDNKREGIETKYLVSKANKTIKSTKTYHLGKLHGKCITYNVIGEIIKEQNFTEGILLTR